MKSLFITLFAIVLACNAPSSLAAYIGWPSAGNAGSLGGWGNGGGDAGGWGIGGARAGGDGAGRDGAGRDGAGRAGVGAPAGWAGTGCGSGPQMISATWGANLPGPAINLVPAGHAQLVKLLPGLQGHGCSG